MPSRQLALKITLGVMGILLAAGVIAGWHYITLIRSAGWPSTAGVITESRLHELDEGKTPGYTPEIRYRYRVGDTELAGRQITCDSRDQWRSKEDANKELDKYPTGKPVSVYYNPSAPDQAVLRPGVTLRLGLFFGAVVLLFAAGFIMFVLVLQEYRKRDRAAF